MHSPQESRAGVLHFHPDSVIENAGSIKIANRGGKEDYHAVSISVGDPDRGQASIPYSLALPSSKISASSPSSIGRGSATLRGVVTAEVIESEPICMEGDVASSGDGG